MNSYAKCLQSLACNVTNRGKAVFKNASIGMIAGAASGGGLAGAIIGIHYAVLADHEDVSYRHDHYKEYPGCSYVKGFLQCEDPAVKEKIFQLSYAYRDKKMQEWLSNPAPWIGLGLTLGGAALGMFIGIAKGYQEQLPSEQPSINKSYMSMA